MYDSPRAEPIERLRTELRHERDALATKPLANASRNRASGVIAPRRTLAGRNVTIRPDRGGRPVGYDDRVYFTASAILLVAVNGLAARVVIAGGGGVMIERPRLREHDAFVGRRIALRVCSVMVRSSSRRVVLPVVGTR